MGVLIFIIHPYYVMTLSMCHPSACLSVHLDVCPSVHLKIVFSGQYLKRSTSYQFETRYIASPMVFLGGPLVLQSWPWISWSLGAQRSHILPKWWLRKFQSNQLDTWYGHLSRIRLNDCWFRVSHLIYKIQGHWLQQRSKSLVQRCPMCFPNDNSKSFRSINLKLGSDSWMTLVK